MRLLWGAADHLCGWALHCTGRGWREPSPPNSLFTSTALTRNPPKIMKKSTSWPQNLEAPRWKKSFLFTGSCEWCCPFLFADSVTVAILDLYNLHQATLEQHRYYTYTPSSFTFCNAQHFNKFDRKVSNFWSPWGFQFRPSWVSLGGEVALVAPGGWDQYAVWAPSCTGTTSAKDDNCPPQVHS